MRIGVGKRDGRLDLGGSGWRAATCCLLLALSGCGPSGIEGFWWASPQTNAGQSIYLAVGYEGSQHVWTLAAYDIGFAHYQTVAYCQLNWTQSGATVRYVGDPAFVEAAGAVSKVQVQVTAPTFELTWQMSKTFNDRATQYWKTDHPSADPSLSLKGEVIVTGTIPKGGSLLLHTQSLATDAATGKPLADEQADWHLERSANCVLDPM